MEYLASGKLRQDHSWGRLSFDDLCDLQVCCPQDPGHEDIVVKLQDSNNDDNGMKLPVDLYWICCDWESMRVSANFALRNDNRLMPERLEALDLTSLYARPIQISVLAPVPKRYRCGKSEASIPTSLPQKRSEFNCWFATAKRLTQYSQFAAAVDMLFHVLELGPEHTHVIFQIGWIFWHKF